ENGKKRKKESPKKEVDQKEDAPEEYSGRRIIETVIPANSSLTGRTLKSLNFNQQYDAVVIGIHRNGVELQQKIGLIPLMPGDLLLMVPGEEFWKLTTQEDDFYVVSIIKNINKVSKKIRYGFVGALAAVILGLLFDKIGLFLALLILLRYMFAG